LGVNNRIILKKILIKHITVYKGYKKNKKPKKSCIAKVREIFVKTKIIPVKFQQEQTKLKIRFTLLENNSNQ
jgi:hypothetical protein